MKKIVVLSLLSMLMFLTGCTTHVLKENRDESFQGKFSSLRVNWIDNPMLGGVITKSVYGGPASVTSGDRKSAQDGVPQVLAVLKNGVAESLLPMLKARGVVTDNLTSPQAILMVRPQSSQSDCTPLACQHSLIMYVSLTDDVSKKVVWSGSFKVGAPWPSDQTPEVAKNFYGTVVDKLPLAKPAN